MTTTMRRSVLSYVLWMVPIVAIGVVAGCATGHMALVVAACVVCNFIGYREGRRHERRQHLQGGKEKA